MSCVTLNKFKSDSLKTIFESFWGSLSRYMCPSRGFYFETLHRKRFYSAFWLWRWSEGAAASVLPIRGAAAALATLPSFSPPPPSVPHSWWGEGGRAAVKSQWCHSRMWQSRWAAFSPPLLTVSGVPSSASGALERSGAAKDDHRHRHRLKLRRAPTLSSCCSDPRRWVPDLPSSPHQPSPPPMPKDGT